MTEAHDYSALKWLDRELGETIGQARKALQEFVEGSGSKGAMEECAGHIHQVQGILQMVQVHGAMLLAREIEASARKLAAGEVEGDEEENAEVVMMGLIRLPDYLEQVQADKLDNPLLLGEMVNELRGMRKEKPLNDAQMLGGRFDAKLRSSSGDGKPNPQVAKMAKAVRPRQQRGLLSWIRGTDVAGGLENIKKTMEVLERQAGTDQVRRFLRIVRAALVLPLVDPDGTGTSVKKLFARVDQVIKNLVEGGEQQVIENLPLELMQNLLFEIGVAETEHDELGEVRQEFDLAWVNQCIQAGNVATGMRSTNREMLTSFRDALSDDLTGVKDKLDVFIRTGSEDPAQLSQLENPLRTIAGTLAMVGQENLRKRLIKQADLLRDTASQGQMPGDSDLMSMAGDILFVETSLSNLATAQEQAPAVEEDATARALDLPSGEYEKLVTTVIQQATIDMRKCKDAILGYLKAPDDVAVLNQVPMRFATIAGAFDLLQLAPASSLVKKLASFVSDLIVKRRVQLDKDRMNIFADTVTSVEYFMETMEEGRGVQMNILTFADQSLNDLVEMIGDEDRSAQFASDQQPMPQVELELGDVDELIATQGGMDSTVPIDVEVVESAGDLEQQQAEQKILDEVDPEILEVFIEEAREELSVIREFYPRWKNDREDRDALVTFRRSFHTLKGSGRLVGAVAIGELAWSVENLLNRIIDQTVPVTNEALEVIEEASGALPALVECLEKGREPKFDAQPMIDKAFALVKQEEQSAEREASQREAERAESAAANARTVADEEPADVAEEDLAGVEESSADEEPGTVTTAEKQPADESAAPQTVLEDVDPEILEIFIEEAKEEIESLGHHYPMWRDNQSDNDALTTFRRSFHTLKGSGRMVGAATIGELAWSIENLVNRVIDKTVPVTSPVLEVIDETIQHLPHLIDCQEHGKIPQIHVQPMMDRAFELAKPGGADAVQARGGPSLHELVTGGESSSAAEEEEEPEPPSAEAEISAAETLEAEPETDFDVATDDSVDFSSDIEMEEISPEAADVESFVDEPATAELEAGKRPEEPRGTVDLLESDAGVELEDVDDGVSMDIASDALDGLEEIEAEEFSLDGLEEASAVDEGLPLDDESEPTLEGLNGSIDLESDAAVELDELDESGPVEATGDVSAFEGLELDDEGSPGLSIGDNASEETFPFDLSDQGNDTLDDLSATDVELAEGESVDEDTANLFFGDDADMDSFNEEAALALDSLEEEEPLEETDSTGLGESALLDLEDALKAEGEEEDEAGTSPEEPLETAEDEFSLEGLSTDLVETVEEGDAEAGLDSESSELSTDAFAEITSFDAEPETSESMVEVKDAGSDESFGLEDLSEDLPDAEAIEVDDLNEASGGFELNESEESGEDAEDFAFSVLDETEEKSTENALLEPGEQMEEMLFSELDQTDDDLLSPEREDDGTLLDSESLELPDTEEPFAEVPSDPLDNLSLDDDEDRLGLGDLAEGSEDPEDSPLEAADLNLPPEEEDEEDTGLLDMDQEFEAVTLSDDSEEDDLLGSDLLESQDEDDLAHSAEDFLQSVEDQEQTSEESDDSEALVLEDDEASLARSLDEAFLETGLAFEAEARAPLPPLDGDSEEDADWEASALEATELEDLDEVAIEITGLQQQDAATAVDEDAESRAEDLDERAEALTFESTTDDEEAEDIQLVEGPDVTDNFAFESPDFDLDAEDGTPATLDDELSAESPEVEVSTEANEQADEGEQELLASNSLVDLTDTALDLDQLEAEEEQTAEADTSSQASLKTEESDSSGAAETQLSGRRVTEDMRRQGLESILRSMSERKKDNDQSETDSGSDAAPMSYDDTTSLDDIASLLSDDTLIEKPYVALTDSEESTGAFDDLEQEASANNVSPDDLEEMAESLDTASFDTGTLDTRPQGIDKEPESDELEDAGEKEEEVKLASPSPESGSEEEQQVSEAEAADESSSKWDALGLEEVTDLDSNDWAEVVSQLDDSSQDELLSIGSLDDSGDETNASSESDTGLGDLDGGFSDQDFAGLDSQFDAEMTGLVESQLFGDNPFDTLAKAPSTALDEEAPVAAPIELDATLQEIFSAETHNHVGVLRAYLEACEKNQNFCTIDEGVLRALHTLRGSAHMAEVEPISELCSAMEGYAKALAARGGTPDDSFVELLSRTVVIIEAVLKVINVPGGELPDWRPLEQQANERLEMVREENAAAIQLQDSGELASERASPEETVEKQPDQATPEASKEGTTSPEPPAPSAASESLLPSDGEPILVMADEELIEVFFEEADELLESLDHTLVAWIDAPDDPEHMSELQRTLHTLKGSSRLAGVTPIGDLSHSLESLLVAMRQEKVAMDSASQHFCQQVADRLVQQLDEVRDTRRCQPADGLVSILTRLTDGSLASAEIDGLLNGSVGASAAPPAADQPAVATPAPSSNKPSAEPPARESTTTQAIAEETVEVDADPELTEIFLEEAADLLEALDGTVHEWGGDPYNLGPLSELQRVLHTLKGSSRLAGITPVGDLSHAFESLLIAVKQEEIGMTPSLFTLIQAVTDKLSEKISEVRDAGRVVTENALIAEVDAARQGKHFKTDSVAAKPQPSPPQPAQEVPAEQQSEPDFESTQFTATQVVGGDQTKGGKGDKKRPTREQVRVRPELLDRLVNYSGEISIYRARLEEQNSSLGFNLSEMIQTVGRLRTQLRSLEIETEAQILSRYEREAEEIGEEMDKDFDPLEMDQFSNMQQISRALVETVSDLSNINDALETLQRGTDTLLLQQSRVSADIQDGLMRTRMVSFSQTVPRLRRLVRQTCSSQKKKAELEIVGGDAEIDRNILERMLGPIEHLLRNSVSHGVEAPAERIKRGKSESGTITFTLAREGNDVVIEIADDGAGLNKDRIREKAISKGLLAPNAQVAEEDLLQFILAPGFSTAAQVDQVAGRGVGMDVVVSEVKQMGGALKIQSEFGKGARFILNLPLTLAVTDSLLMKLGDDIFSVPHNGMEGVVRISHEHLVDCYEGRKEGFEYAGQIYKLRYLGDILGNSTMQLPENVRWYPLLLVRAGEHRIALHVDELLGNREVVVKPLGPQLNGLRWLSGGTILADGQVALILDAPAVVRMDAAQTSVPVVEMTQVTEDVPVEDRKLLVMVVDDSITVRKVTTRFLTRHDMEVVSAKDGVDAVAQLQDVRPDVMLLDIEMPRMDGYEVARHVKHSDDLKEIPIIMITSRTGEKHRNVAMELGVERYLGKPYQEVELLETINELVGAEA